MVLVSNTSGSIQCGKQSRGFICIFVLFKEEMGREEEPLVEVSLENLRERDHLKNLGYMGK